MLKDAEGATPGLAVGWETFRYQVPEGDASLESACPGGRDTEGVISCLIEEVISQVKGQRRSQKAFLLSFLCFLRVGNVRGEEKRRD